MRLKSLKKVGLLVLFIILSAHAFVLQEKSFYAQNLVFQEMQKECTNQEIRKMLDDLECFPVAQEKRMQYENGYGDDRSYGGKRKHEGIDIIPDKEKDNYYAVQAASDGVVEQIGWLKLGGYRVGIRSKNGFYYYYAHLASYAEGIKKGRKVKAGDIIGYMGNTGYGKEGTKGKFMIHLHFGIYRQVDGKEKSLNPYFLLRYLQE